MVTSLESTSRIHIQFSGSLQVVDADQIVRLLREAIERRPKNCGAVLSVRELGINDPDEAMTDIGGIAIPTEQIVKATEPNK